MEEITITVTILCCTAFFIAGFVDAIAGGGGLITVPALLLCGVPPHTTLGTGKFASTLGSLTALWTFARNHLVEMRIAPAGFLAAVAGSMAGAALTLLIDSALLGRILFFLLPVGLVLSLLSGRSFSEEAPLPERGLWLRVLLVGFLIGMYDGFFGPGAGSFYIIALHFFLRMGLVRASATAKVFNMASNAGAFLMFATGGTVVYSLGVPLAVSSILGNQLGVRLAIRVGSRAVRAFLYVTLSLLLATLAYRFFLS
ncbi:TSUP family transporter [uncultured Mailhella sp.]|uniref:sulfite exporter TauE/SafE family protein n=1 Tax=uncultured Mailhella sp. TaxID=1981031 RepID=UPI002616B34E|nr:TSUP family transporter [uncultured Mailhella sp.]